MNIEKILPELVGTLASLPEHTQKTIQAYGAACYRTALQSSEVQALKRDAERLMFACEFDAYTTVSKDRYDYAIECAEEAGRDAPIKEDELNGLRRLIDAAIDHASRIDGDVE